MTSVERTQSGSQRRRQILSAARDVFKESGYEHSTISDIVKRAGVAQGTFYLHFDSKKSIVVELARQPMAEMAVRLQAILKGDESFEEILRKFVRLGFEVGADNPDLCRLIHLNADDPESTQDLHAESRVNQMAIGMFERFISTGEMVEMDPAVAAEMFRIVMSGSMQLAFGSGAVSTNADEIAKAVETLIVRAFVTRPS